MSDLIAFVSARLGDDEAAAKSAGGDEWALDDPVRYPGRVVSATHVITDYGGLPDEQAAHIARHGPARALRDVAAGRKLLDAYRRLSDTKTRHDKAAAEYQTDVEQEERTGQDPGPGNLGTRGRALLREADYLDAMLPVLRGLVADRAAVWSGHPDYDPAWATP